MSASKKDAKKWELKLNLKVTLKKKETPEKKQIQELFEGYLKRGMKWLF